MRGCYFYLFLLFLTSSSTTVIAWYLPSETNLETSNIISPSMHDPVHTDIRYFLIKDYLISYFLLIQVLLRKNISFLRWNNARQIYSVFFQFHLHKYFCKLFLKCNFFHFYVNKYPHFFYLPATRNRWYNHNLCCNWNVILLTQFCTSMHSV